MEDWFHDCNEKDEENNARPLIANVVKILQELFQREERSNRYCIPKMHGMTKFQSWAQGALSMSITYRRPGEPPSGGI